MKQTRLLLIEDEKRMADALAELLSQEGYEVTVCGEGTEGAAAILEHPWELIILDVMLPGMNGFEILQLARDHGVHTPILMLTAKSETADEVRGLDSGADDYLTKPFRVETLLARLRVLLRRSKPLEEDILTFGDISLNRKTAVLACNTNGQDIRLSEKEFRILEHLLVNQRQILTRESLALKVWGYESEAEYNKVEVYISFTRRKMAFIGAKTEIKAVRGLGYELRANDVSKITD